MVDSNRDKGFCRKVRFLGQNPKIGYQKFNDLQTAKLSQKQTLRQNPNRGRKRKIPISDSGGAFTSNDVTAVLQRLQITPNPLLSTQGESYKNLMETHCNIQRRLYDYQCSLTTTPAEFEQAHQTFMETYNTTAHEGLLKDGLHPPVPLQVLGQAKGRLYTPEELARRFSRGFCRKVALREFGSL